MLEGYKLALHLSDQPTREGYRLALYLSEQPRESQTLGNLTDEDRWLAEVLVEHLSEHLVEELRLGDDLTED